MSCSCTTQHPGMTIPYIWHTCRPPKAPGDVWRDWDAFDQRVIDEGGATGRFPREHKKPVWDALSEEEARSPISRYLSGGVPAYQEPPFTNA